MNQIRVNLFDVDLVIVIMAYILLVFGEIGAGVFAISQGFLIDIFSGGFLGLFTLLYLNLFLGIHLGSRLFDLRSLRGQAIIISLAVLSKGILLIFLLHIFSLEILVSFPFLPALATSAMGSALIGPFVFMLLNQLKHLLMRGTEGTSENGLRA